MQGYNYDYYIMAVNGTIFYLIYCMLGFFTNIKGAGTVLLGDLLWTVFNACFLIIQMVQFCIYPTGNNRITARSVIPSIFLWALVISNILFVELFGVIQPT